MNKMAKTKKTDAAPKMIRFLPAVLICFIKYRQFGGRATRAELWWFYLFTMSVRLGLLYISPDGVLSVVWSIVVLVPSLAVGARRLNDIGGNGWWQLLYLTFFGVPVLIFLFCLRTKTDQEIAAQHGALARMKRVEKWVLAQPAKMMKPTKWTRYSRFRLRPDYYTHAHAFRMGCALIMLALLSLSMFIFLLF